MKSINFHHLLLFNFAMLCLCTSGSLGRYISLPPPLTIWYRALFALSFLGIFCFWKKYSFQFDIKKHGWTIFLSGCLMALNFICYFYALQWSNVAIGMLALFTFPVMTTLLEPLFFETSFQWEHFVLAIMILFGIYFLVPDFDMENKLTQGLLIGLFSAFCWSIRNLILKTKIHTFNSSILMFYQLLIMLIILSPGLIIYQQEIISDQLPYLVFLGLITTALGHTLFIHSFKHFSVSSASILAGIQPIYGIIVAMIFLNEIPSSRSLLGGAIIILTVIIEGWRSFRRFG